MITVKFHPGFSFLSPKQCVCVSSSVFTCIPANQAVNIPVQSTLYPGTNLCCLNQRYVELTFKSFARILILSVVGDASNASIISCNATLYG